MKKLFLFALGLCTSAMTFAQDAPASGGVRVGAKAGLNYSNIIKTGDSDFKTEFKPGFHAGLFLEIPIVSGFSFAPEIVYSQKGYKETGSSLLGGENEFSVTSNFVEVPILAKINAGTGFHIVLGPQVSFLTSTTEEFKQGTEAYRRTIEEENDNLKKSLFGGVVGFGFDINNRLGLNARYALDLQRNNGDGSTQIPEYKNQVIQVGLGLKF